MVGQFPSAERSLPPSQCPRRPQPPPPSAWPAVRHAAPLGRPRATSAMLPVRCACAPLPPQPLPPRAPAPPSPPRGPRPLLHASVAAPPALWPERRRAAAAPSRRMPRSPAPSCPSAHNPAPRSSAWLLACMLSSPRRAARCQRAPRRGGGAPWASGGSVCRAQASRRREEPDQALSERKASAGSARGHAGSVQMGWLSQHVGLELGIKLDLMSALFVGLSNLLERGCQEACRRCELALRDGGVRLAQGPIDSPGRHGCELRHAALRLIVLPDFVLLFEFEPRPARLFRSKDSGPLSLLPLDRSFELIKRVTLGSIECLALSLELCL
eukprot:scaffold77108_cov64-Phaeocystis_antarctica.AAC.3